MTMNIGKISPSFLYSLRNQPMGWKTATGELIDNSFDAGATRVELDFTSDGRTKQFTISDNGAGCASIEKMLTLGEHISQDTTSLGRFGVGLKHAVLWLWGEMDLSTIRDGICRSTSIDWGRLASAKTWDMPDAFVQDSTGQGTTITVRKHKRVNPQEKTKLPEHIGYIFAPALRSGRQILVKLTRAKKFTAVKAWERPECTEHVTCSFTVNGKGVELDVGLVSFDRLNDKPGFSYCHGHRIIENTAFGSKGKSVRRISGLVILDDKWTLGTNKTQVVDDDNGLLEDEIYKRCERLLQTAADEENIIHNMEFENEISEMLGRLQANSEDDDETPNKKEKRDSPENESGTIERKDSGRKRKPRSKSQPGDSLADKCKAGKFRLEYEYAGDKEIGRVDFPGSVVYLNVDHDSVTELRDKQLKEATLILCLTLIANEATDIEEQGTLPFGREFSGFLPCLTELVKGTQLTEEVSA